MKKIFCLITVVLLAGGSLMAQEQEGKKKGGFMKSLKKGVESTTGLKVSDETLFVYPTVGEWKMQLNSCIGNRATGEVVMTITVNKIGGKQLLDVRCLLTGDATVTGGGKVSYGRYPADPLHNFRINTPVQISLQTLYEVPTDAKSLDVSFYIRDKGIMFEARRVPIEWRDGE